MNKYMLFLFASVVISSFSQIILKKGARKRYASVWQEYLNPYVIMGYGIMVITTILTVLAYRGIDYKNGPVIESMGYVLVMLLSRLFFAEKITRHKLLGNALIMVGVLVFYL